MALYPNLKLPPITEEGMLSKKTKKVANKTSKPKKKK